MKNYYFLSFIFLIVSCSSYKNFSDQEYILNDNSKQNLKIVNNQPFIEVALNGNKGLFLFDTGASTSLLTDSLFFNKIKTDENLVKSKLYNAYKEELTSYKILVKNVNSEIFDSKNILINYYELNNKPKLNNCTTNTLSKTHGIIGLNNFINSEKIILLDFEKNFIQIVDENFEKSGFKEVKSKFKFLNKKIILPMKLNNKEIDFLFDTGNNSGFIVDNKSFKDEVPSAEFEMYMGGFNGISIQQTKRYNNIEISNFPFNLEKQNISSLSNGTTNTLGMSFLNKFNWIIDFENEKIYCKLNGNKKSADSAEKTPPFQSFIIENKLIIGYKLKSKTKFNVGDQIVKINFQKVTQENICEMNNLLNKTEDWDLLNLEIISN